MTDDAEREQPARWVVAVLLLVPLVAGAILLLGFEGGEIRDVGLFLVAAAVIVAGAVLVINRGE